jgi:hypothetical protein
MNASQLPDSALLGKIEAFFALRLAAMQSVLDYRAVNEGIRRFYVDAGWRKPASGIRWVIGQKRV